MSVPKCKRYALRHRLLFWLLSGAALAGCAPPAGSAEPRGTGPGDRPQRLVLTPEQEAALGRQAFIEVLAHSHVLRDGAEPRRVARVLQRIAEAARIEPLQREINLRTRGFSFAWESVVLDDPRVNAFCLPGGYVGVFRGLLGVLPDGAVGDAQLATVLSHEAAHALAHHASERIAREQRYHGLLDAAHGALNGVEAAERERLIGLLGAGASLESRHYDRQQESEADHIGVFLMTFAGYDPAEAVRFWDRMRRSSAGRVRLPELLSDHPSDARRIVDLGAWAPRAKAAKEAYDAGRIAPPDRTRGSREAPIRRR
jgi:predicted Zn-dependent protease